MKTITFLLPNAVSNKPIGGVKIIYEYANRLAADGYNVNIIYPRYTKILTKGIINKLKNKYIAWNAYKNKSTIQKTFKDKTWFTLDDRINEISVPYLQEKYIPQSDIYIASMYNTAFALSAFKTKAPKFYFIQGYDNYHSNDQSFLDSFKLDLNKIVISDWLVDIAKKFNQETELLYNGFDFDYFKLTMPIKERSPYSIAIMYNPDPWKGFNEAFKAISLAKEKIPEIRVNMFGRDDRPAFFPDWVNYIKTPTREQHNLIYNTSSIFVIGSHHEGWGLPVGEAMICGCAIICTDIGGFKAMTFEDKTALISPVGDFETMSHNILRLIYDNDKRIEIAQNGNHLIQSFTMEKAYQNFKRIILNNQ